MAGAPACAAAQSAAPSGANAAYVLPGSECLPLTSSINGVDYVLYVRAPRAANGPSPVIVTLDADYQFAIAANHLEHLADRAGQAPDAVLVSIAYRDQYPDQALYRRNRTRDYTPFFWPEGGYGEEMQRVSGGGPLFRRVIAEEVLPLIDARYPIDANDRTIVGHSYGGLFAAWLLCTHPDLFSRYLLISPSLWYADRFMLSASARRPDPTPMPRPTRAYMSVGSWEEQPDNGITMVSDLQAFAGQLVERGDPLLETELRVFEDETHASIFPAAFSTGVRHLFG